MHVVTNLPSNHLFDLSTLSWTIESSIKFDEPHMLELPIYIISVTEFNFILIFASRKISSGLRLLVSPFTGLQSKVLK